MSPPRSTSQARLMRAAVAISEGAGSASARGKAPTTALGAVVGDARRFDELNDQVSRLTRQLEAFQGSMQMRRLDPTRVLPSRWANRDARSYESVQFKELTRDIEVAGGNVQPILVREIGPDRWEIIFGHRRHQACLQLGIRVSAVIWDKPLDDQAHLALMDRENRQRQDPSPYEQGMTYCAALEAKVFASRRKLAESLGLSHTWVNKACMVGSLPPAVLNAFRTPLEVQPHQAEALHKALETDRRAVLQRVEKLKRDGTSATMTADLVTKTLLGVTTVVSKATKLMLGATQVGTFKLDSKGRPTFVLDAAYGDEESVRRIQLAISQAIGSP